MLQVKCDDCEKVVDEVSVSATPKGWARLKLRVSGKVADVLDYTDRKHGFDKDLCDDCLAKYGLAIDQLEQADNAKDIFWEAVREIVQEELQNGA